MFYLLNRASKSRTVFTIGFLTSRSSKLDPMLIGFDDFFTKKWTKKPNREHGFFPFRKRHVRASDEITTVPLAEAKPCPSRKKKEQKAIFSVPKRHGRDSRENTSVPLTKEKK